MTFTRWAVASAMALIPLVLGLASTDSPSDADPAQSGYLPNHNMDPAVVDSAEFGQLWKIQFNAREQFYAKPLVYTPTGSNQLVFLASSQNWIRTLDAKTGDPINSRQVQTPFLQSDIGCTDIPNTIGIIGTPIIDPATDIVYFFAKTYIPNYRTPGATGTINGVYYFYGVNINTLADAPGFPILVDGVPSDNDAAKYFIGGVVLQRPALAQVGSVVYGGFGGHCDLFNYSGLVVGVDVNQKQVVTNFATESGPLVAQTNQWDENGGGGMGGIWMSGMALSTDGERLFFVSGNNGQGHENDGAPASGSSGCQTLGEACVNLNIGAGGKLSLTDYFQPYDYQNMDGGDQDFGSGGIALLDPGTFKGTGVSKMAVTAGKNGKIYILNANNLGGYRLGAGQTDEVIQTIVTNKAVFGGSGSYPLEGGYIYSTPIGYPTYVYKLGFSSSGVPIFTQVGATTELSAGRVGVGIPTITTNAGKEGTAILWMCDPDAGLRAWYAVPNPDGTMTSIKLPQVNGLNKFQRPAFGDTRLYVTDANGALYCLGSPVNLPLNCTSPVNFGSVPLGTAQTEQVSCQANIAITQIQSVTTGDANFQVDPSTLPKGAIKAGATFSFPVTWNLTTTHNGNAANASYGNVAPGVKSTALTLTTVNAIVGYSTQFPIGLTGTEVSTDAFMEIAPVTVDYSGLVILDPDNPPTNALSFTITNAGLTNLTILGYAYTTDDLDDDDIDYTNTTFSDEQDLGYGFTSSDLPPVGTVINGGNQLSVDSMFTPVNGTGNYASFLTVWSTGGDQSIILEGSASTAPIANFSISTSEGGWLPGSNLLMDFGDVVPGSTPSLQIRICNQGGSVLQVEKSKPPNGVFHPDDPTELHESQDIPVDECAYGTVLFASNVEPPNTPDQVYNNTWTLNTDDLTFGVHVVEIQGVVKSRTVGPTNSTGQPVYSYLGCYQDSNVRLLPDQPYANSSNDNDLCQSACLGGNYVFSGTEYQVECYCGNNAPPYSAEVDEAFCTFSCAGDPTQVCGGVGGYLSVYYDSTRYTPGSNSVAASTSGPITVNQTGNYNYIGCFSEATNGRALSGQTPAIPGGTNTIESCQAACQGFTYFGAEYSNECYCGNTINAGSIIQSSTDPNANGCSMLCGGNSSEYCGGPNRLNMYQLNGSLPVPTPTSPVATGPTTSVSGPTAVPSAGNYGYLGCYTDSTADRALTGLVNPVSGSSLTVDLCVSACKGFTYAGLEYSAECYCGNTLLGGSTLASGGSDPTQNLCSMTCDGNTNEYCGGPNRLSLYEFNSSLASMSASTVLSGNTSAAATLFSNTASVASATATTPASSTPSPTGPTTVQNSTAFSYLGCYSDSVQARALTGLANPGDSTKNSVEACSLGCAGYTYFGVEYSAECYCGMSINTGSTLVAGSSPDSTQCNMVCSGDSSEYCGGPNRLNMYQNIPEASVSSSMVLTSSALPLSTSISIASTSTISGSSSSTAVSSSATPLQTGPVHVQAVGAYQFQGCYNESTNIRALSGAAYVNASSMTVEICAGFCQQQQGNLVWMGVEYGQECYCGTSPNVGSVLNPLADCNMPCAGNSSEYCGAGYRLDMYKLAISSSSSLSSTASSMSSATLSSSASITMGSTTLTSLSSASISTSTTSSSATASTLSLLPSTTQVSTSASIGTSVAPSVSWTSAAVSSVLSSTSLSTSTVVGSSMATSVLMSSSSMGNSASTTGSSSFILTLSINSGSSISSSGSFVTSASLSSIQKTPSASSTSTLLTTMTTSSLMQSSTTLLKTSTTSATVHTPAVGEINSAGWAYLGCANETTPRALTSASFVNKTGMTIESCQSFCNNSNYGLSGLEFGQECYCGNALQNYAALGKTGCSEVCTGNSSEICGAANLISVYNNTDFVPPSAVQQVGYYPLAGCYQEASSGRLLTGPSYSNATGMTVESCVNYCQTTGKGYNVAGVEWSQQCFCASTLPTTASQVGLGSCNMLCSGNNHEFCGGSRLLNVYVYNATSVSSQGVPASMNAGNKA